MSTMNAPYNSSSTQQPAAICALKSPADAIHILEAVRLGMVPRVTRRLTGHERSMIRPGTVWVWEEEETNMRRWTDGRRWGASRVGGGGFLVYTESSESHSPPQSGYGPNGYFPPRKVESLIKQTYSTTMTHPGTGKLKKFHVVAYSSKYNPQGDAHNQLPLPHQLPLLANLKVTAGVWPEWEHQRNNETYRKPQSSGPPSLIPSPSDPSSSFPRVPPSPHTQEYPQLSPSVHRTDFPPPIVYDRRVPQPMLSPGILPSPSQPPMTSPGQGPSPGQILSPGQMPMPNTMPYPPQPQQYGDRYYPYQNRGYPVTPTEPYYDDRRERSPTRGYAQPYPYYPRDRYDEQAPYAPGYPVQPMPDGRYPEQPPVHTYTPGHARQTSGSRIPPTPTSSNSQPDMAQQQAMAMTGQNAVSNGVPGANRQSPKLSISNSLLNPEGNGDMNVNVNGSSNGTAQTQPGGLTLPPLRMVDGPGSSPQQNMNGTISPHMSMTMNGNGTGGATPNGMGGISMNTVTMKKAQGNDRDGLQTGEDARQLGELGRRVA